MSCLEKKFWLENLGALFSSIQFVPYGNMSLAEQMNSITRVILILGVIMWLFNFQYTIQFVVFSLLFVIIIYYIQKNKMQRGINSKESFNPSIVYSSEKVGNTYKTILTDGVPTQPNFGLSIDPPSEVAVTLNQRLSRYKKDGMCVDSYPATKIPPVIVPPSYDLDTWKDNNLITMSTINSPGVQQDMYLSGYVTPSYCESTLPIENYHPECKGTIFPPVPVYTNIPAPSVPIRENYTHQYTFPETVDTTNGYNPKQLQYDLPSNLPFGNCYQTPQMKKYNNNIFNQTVSPGTYTINQVNEAINSNIGISYTQQFEPVTYKVNEKGLQFTLNDPRVLEPDISPSEKVKSINYDNVYDPRFYGYGTSYRSYVDPVVGQVRYMYDDVNAIRMPNYVTRSKIDHIPVADKYGPMQDGGEFGNPLTYDMKNIAQETWMNDSIFFRDDLQQNLMRKVNAEAWQKRMAPNSSRPVGSYSKIK